MDALQVFLRRARATMAGFTPGQIGVIGIGVAVLIAAGFAFTKWSAAPYSPLFSNLAAADASAVVTQLDTSGVAYQLSDGGATILVPQDKVYETRLAMSAKGIPSQSQGGYSLLDQQGITTSEFMQNVTYQRAVEGELAKTVQAIQGVKTATVHLAMPAKSVFTQEGAKPTASVMVSLAAGQSLTSDQVTAITNLVASSVPDLTAANVAVVDSTGTLLTNGTGAGGAGATSQIQYQARTEAQLAAAAQTMLDNVLGAGNTAVRVHADLDFDQRTTKTQSYQYTAGTPPISSSTSAESYTGTGAAPGGVVGTGTTTSVVGTGTTGAAGNTYNKTATTANNAVGSTVEDRTGSLGTIKRLTVAVLINAKAGAGATSPTAISQLVANAVGLSTTRGDTIQVTPMAFDTSAQSAAAAELQTASDAAGKAALFDMVRKVAIGFLVLVVLLLAFLSARRQRRTLLDAEELEAIGYRQEPLALTRGEEYDLLEGSVVVDADPPRAIEQAQAEISELVAKQPDEVAQLLRGWISAGR